MAITFKTKLPSEVTQRTVYMNIRNINFVKRTDGGTITNITTQAFSNQAAREANCDPVYLGNDIPTSITVLDLVDIPTLADAYELVKTNLGELKITTTDVI